MPTLAATLALMEEVRRLAQEQARERQFYSDLFEHAPEARLVTDASAKICAANRAAAALLGRNPAGKLLVVFLPLAERPGFRRFLAEAPESSSWRCSAFSARVRRAPGGLCWTLT